MGARQEVLAHLKSFTVRMERRTTAMRNRGTSRPIAAAQARIATRALTWPQGSMAPGSRRLSRPCEFDSAREAEVEGAASDAGKKPFSTRLLMRAG